ncbi:unnamed protein product, partial [Effrenium voratum]
MADLRKEIARLQKRQQREAWHLERAGLTPRQKKLVLTVYMCSGFCVDAAQGFVEVLQRKRKSCQGQPTPDVVEWFNSLPEEEMVRLCWPEAPADERILAEAERHVAGLQTSRWVQDMNYSRGVAVPTYNVAAEYRRRAGGQQPALQSSMLGRDGRRGRPGRYLRLWAQRFRAKWGLAYQRIPACSFLPAEELVEKAGPEQTRAKLFFHWIDWLEQQAGVFHKELAFVNLDESSLQLSFLHEKGTVVKRSQWRQGVGPKRARPSRGAVTLICLSSADPALQRRLRQYLVGNKSIFLQKDLRAVRDAQPENIRVFRETSSWATSQLITEVLSDLETLAASFPSKQLCVVMDSAAQHLSERVVRRAADANIWLCVVPPKATGYMQPLDVQTFSLLKHHLKDKFTEVAMSAAGGVVSRQAWLRVLFGLCEFMNSREWRRGFEACGICGRGNLSTELS